MCYSHLDHQLLVREAGQRTRGLAPAPKGSPATRWRAALKWLRAAVAGLLGLGALASCGSPASSVARLGGDGGSIAVAFQNFPDGTRCTVQTPQGPLIVNEMPGQIAYPGIYRASPITCSTPAGVVYGIDVESSLPESFASASFTVYSDGRLSGTVPVNNEMVQVQRSDAVRRLN